MPPQPPLPKVDPGDAKGTGTRVINSDNGWNSLSRALTVSIPHNVSHARRAVAGVHTLIRTGR